MVTLLAPCGRKTVQKGYENTFIQTNYQNYRSPLWYLVSIVDA